MRFPKLSRPRLPSLRQLRHGLLIVFGVGLAGAALVAVKVSALEVASGSAGLTETSLLVGGLLALVAATALTVRRAKVVALVALAASMGALLLAGTGLVLCGSLVLLWWLLGLASAAVVASTLSLKRGWLGATVSGALGRLASLLAFPVVYVREQFWTSYFSVCGVALLYAVIVLATNHATGITLWALAGGGLAVITGGVYHLMQHRFAGALALGIAVLMVLGGCALMLYRSEDVQSYNAAMAANNDHQWESQNKLLEQSLSAYEGNLKRNQLWQLILPEPQVKGAALAHFHKANGLLQSPNKGKEAYLELCKSLARNPGNRYTGLDPDQAARREDDARHAQRNLEKLMTSGQDGGAGQPNGKQGQGKGQQPGQQRDPGKEPQPSSGREPRNSL